MDSNRRDAIFKKRCSDFNLILDTMQNFDDVIVLRSTNGFYVFMDNNFNILHMGPCFYKGVTDLEQIAYLVYQDFATFFPWTNYSLLQALELATSLRVYNQTYSPQETNYFGKLVYYMAFLREEVNYYFQSIYPLMCIGIPTRDVLSYIKGVINGINEVVDVAVSKGEEPKVEDVLTRLGRKDLAKSMYSSVHYVIQLFVNYRNVNTLEMDKRFLSFLDCNQNKGR